MSDPLCAREVILETRAHRIALGYRDLPPDALLVLTIQRHDGEVFDVAITELDCLMQLLRELAPACIRLRAMPAEEERAAKVQRH